MNKRVLYAILAVVVVGLGYYQFSMKPAQEAATQAAQAAADATKAAEEAAAATAKAAEEAAAAATKAAADAAAATTAAATDAAAATTAAAGDMMALLDPTKWDAAKVTSMIAAAPLDDATKKTLTDAVAAAGLDQVKIGEVITQIKTALGM